MSAAQRERALVLLDTGLSQRGFATARAIMQLEEILAEIERTARYPGWERRHPEHYWFRVLGEPGGEEPWAWNVGGHHLAVHLTVVGELVAGTPLFFGANPATCPPSHPHAGLRTLPDEEDLGRKLVTAIAEHRPEAVFAEHVEAHAEALIMQSLDGGHRLIERRPRHVPASRTVRPPLKFRTGPDDLLDLVVDCDRIERSSAKVREHAHSLWPPTP
jgi:hypothetical protein